MIDKLRNHKKSILRSQIDSNVGQSYWLTIVWSSSLLYWVGVYVVTFSGAIMIPHACTHIWRRFHVSLSQYSIACWIFSSDSYIVFNSGDPSGSSTWATNQILSWSKFVT